MILVIGATGEVGSEVIRQLVPLRVPVRALLRNPQKASSLVNLGVEPVLGDLERPETLEMALEGVTRALLLSPVHPRQVELQGNFVEAARRADQAHIVKISGLGTALDSPVRSGRWHAQTEKQIEDAGLPFTFLRPLVFMQNLLRSASSIATQGVIVSAARTSRLAMIDVRDVAAVAVTTLTQDGHAGQVYTLTGPEALSYPEIAGKLSRILGKPVTCKEVSPLLFRQQLLEAGLPEWLVEVRMDFNTAFLEGRASTVTDTVERVTGKPPRTFEQFVRDYASRFQSSSDRTVP